MLKTNSQSGFSLLEVLVVLAIMSVMISVIGVQMVNSVNSTKFAKTSDAAIADLLLLRKDALFSQRDYFVVSSNSDRFVAGESDIIYHLEVPRDWLVTGDIIHISRRGVCYGGKLTIKYPAQNRSATYRISEPSCQGNRIKVGI